MATHRPERRYFHGGAPGLKVRSYILSAKRLGHQYDYGKRSFAQGSIPYDPSLVYVTTDLDAAIGYAARYVNPVTGATGGGWVYEVTPSQEPVPDPDFPFHPDVYLAAPRATVRKIVRRDVNLTRFEQVQLERHHLVWAGPDDYRYDDEGYLLPSEEMAARGVTIDLLRAYGRWLPVEVVDAAGIYTTLPGREMGDALIEDMYARIPALAKPSLHRLSLSGAIAACSFCGYETTDSTTAISHQLGDDLCRALGRGCAPEDLPVLIRQLALHGKAMRPGDWEWFEHHKTTPNSRTNPAADRSPNGASLSRLPATRPATRLRRWLSRWLRRW